MVEAFNKLNEKPDVVFISGHGISHSRLGLASHFSLSTGVPTIAVANSLFEENKISDNGEDILRDNKKEKVGKVLQSKENSNPIYVSPGNMISVNTAYNIVKQMIKQPHKLPEPLHLAHKYAKEIAKELNIN
jgi:deoxyribonuclease V